MPLALHNLKKNKAARKSRKRVGRGNGGTGTYSGRGIKGQKARSGGKRGLKARSLKRRIMQLPKIAGMTGNGKEYYIVNITQIEKVYKDGEVVSPVTLRKKGIITSGAKKDVKILGTGELTKKVSFSKCKFSKALKARLEKAGIEA